MLHVVDVQRRQLGDSILAQDGQPLYQQTGDLGWIWIPFAIAGTLLSGGGLWHLHEKHTEKSDRLKCIEKYTDPKGPWKLSPTKAADICSHEYVPKKGFEFGLNLPSAVIVGAGIFALWILGEVLIKKV